MARPRKNSAATGPTRRSARLASREPSVISTDEHEHERESLQTSPNHHSTRAPKSSLADPKSRAAPSRRQVPKQHPQQQSQQSSPARPTRKYHVRTRTAVVAVENQEVARAEEEVSVVESSSRQGSKDTGSYMDPYDDPSGVESLADSHRDAVYSSLAEQNREHAIHASNLRHSLSALADDLEEQTRQQRPRVTRLQRDFTLRHIEEQHKQALADGRAVEPEGKIEESKAALPAATEVAQPEVPSHSSPAAGKSKVDIAVSSPHPRDNATAASETVNKACQSPTPAPPPAPPATAPSTWRRLVAYIGSPLVSRKRSADDSEQPAQKRMRTENNTPSISRPQASLRDRLVPSSKNPQEPTSLSTISESKESATSNEIPDATPSKPSRLAPQSRAESRKPITSTPARLSATPREPPQTAPARNDTSMAERNRPWSQRAQRVTEKRKRVSTDTWSRSSVHPESGFTSNDGTRPWSWETRTAPRQPLLKNADERMAKIQRFRELQRQLQELSADADIVDMVSRKAKRVKVDHLSSIPHNLPGDSASTFRVPDIDSDGEMDVAEIVQIRGNLFARVDDDTDAEMEGGAARTPLTPSGPLLISAPTPAPVTLKTPGPTRAAPQPPFALPPKSKPQPPPVPNATTAKPAVPATASRPPAQTFAPFKPAHSTTTSNAAANKQKSTFTFPSVGPPPADYHVSSKFVEDARDIFQTGFAAYVSA